MKHSRCGFVVIKVRISGQNYFFMRRDPSWGDVSFIGGHVKERDRGSLSRAAQREFREEVPHSRSLKGIELVDLAGPLVHGPVYSPSAGCHVVYELEFFLLKCGENPRHILDTLGRRTPNVLVREDDLATGTPLKLAELVRILDRTVEGGLQSIPYSWPEDLGPVANMRDASATR